MATHILDAFIVTYGIDASEYKAGEREVNEATKRLREQNKRTFTEMEDRGKSTAATMKGLRNEVVGLGLAFMGVSSLTSLVSGMMTGAASADRLGQTMGMATGKVWAWRMAMKSIPGGNVGEGDAALQSIQRAKMGWQMSGDTGNNVAFSRLGITGNELRNKDAGDILRQLADVQGKMDPQLYASLLQQIGLPASTVAFLQQGKSSVDKLLAQFEKDSAGQEKLAKETEELRTSLITLQTTIMQKLVPPLVVIANGLNRLLNGTAMEGAPTGVDWSNLPIYTAQSVIASITGGSMPGGRQPSGGRSAMDTANTLLRGLGFQPGGGSGGSVAEAAAAPYAKALLGAGFNKTLTAAILGNMKHESGFDSTRVGDGGKARGVLQWHPDRQANFRRMFGTDVSRATPEQVAQFVKWELQNNVSAQGLAAIMKASRSGNAGLTAKLFDQYYERSAGLSRNARAASAQGYHRSISVTNNYNIRSTDPKGAAQEVGQLQRRHAVAQVDRGIAP